MSDLRPDPPVTAFNTCRNGGSGYHTYCRPCQNAKSREYYHRNKGDIAERRRKNLLGCYGISVEQYDEMLAAQGGGCAICGRNDDTFKGAPKRLAVDHDHTCCPGGVTCGKCLRGLLCSSCNNGLGRFRDDRSLLESASRYLGGFER